MQVAEDLEEADKKRKQMFKNYEMQKHFEREQKLQNMTEEERKKYLLEEEEIKKREQEAKKRVYTFLKLIIKISIFINEYLSWLFNTKNYSYVLGIILFIDIGVIYSKDFLLFNFLQVHHPGSKQQFEEVWEEQDHMNKNDFNPKTFFVMHGNIYLNLNDSFCYYLFFKCIILTNIYI